MDHPFPHDEVDPPRGVSRRRFLGGAGAAAAAGLALPPPALGAAPRHASPAAWGATAPVRLAMHQHGSWSEARASWEAQLVQAAATGVDVLYLTDHDFRATAEGYITSLSGVVWARTSTGTLAQQASSASGESIHLLAESATNTAASVTMAVQQQPLTANGLRTSISGQVLEHTVASATLAGGARYEVAVDLGYHPAVAGRRAGNYRLVYRFGGTASGRLTENRGLTGVVLLPTPAPGSTQLLSPETDAAAFWPTMLALDNCMYGVSFAVRSPRRGDVADVLVGGVRFARHRSTPEAVTADLQRLAATYAPAFPSVTVSPTTEISRDSPDLVPYGIAPYFPDDAGLSPDHDTRFHQISSHVHSAGGVVSWCHPFGTSTGPLLSASARITKRRKVFSAMRAVGQFEADLLEVGYSLRGQVDTLTHLDLWDTFSRNGIWLTGNGANDDHTGKNWSGLNNGFLTGAWATGRSDAELTATLAGGRAYTYHPARWPGGELDLLVDDAVPMGAVSVDAQTSRRLAIWAPALPSGSAVQLVSGPVDYSGAVDPGSSVVQTLPPSAFVEGVATLTVDTSTSRFYRVTALTSSGAVMAAGSPVWLLRQDPPGGVPPART